MSVDVDHSSDDSDLLHNISIDDEDDDAQPKALSAREASVYALDMRRKIEDRLERKRIRDELGCMSYDDIRELGF